MVMVHKVRRLLDVLRDNLADLERYASRVTEAELARDRDIQHMVLHAMYATMQASIDLANHVVADRGLPRALTYAATFDRLVEAGILDERLGGRLADWASMRNVLAHFYPVVDYSMVARALREDIHDFKEFAGIIEDMIP